jgi:hypothetical protein
MNRLLRDLEQELLFISDENGLKYRVKTKKYTNKWSFLGFDNNEIISLKIYI